MKTHEIRPVLVQLLVEYSTTSLIPDSIKDDQKLDDLGVDSLDLIELTMSLEDKFNIEISDEDIDSANTVGEFVSMVTRIIGEGERS